MTKRLKSFELQKNKLHSLKKKKKLFSQNIQYKICLTNYGEFYHIITSTAYLFITSKCSTTSNLHQIHKIPTFTLDFIEFKYKFLFTIAQATVIMYYLLAFETENRKVA